ncbi:MAG: TRAP transporter substrate-binding protein DctP [Magnetospirillum sp.]
MTRMLAILGLFLLSLHPAWAQKTQIFLAHAQPQDPTGDTVAAVAEEFRKILDTESDGRLQVEIFPDGILGGNRDMTVLTEKGIIQSALVTVGGVTSLYPPLMVTQLPFAFDTIADAHATLDGPFGIAMALDFKARTKLTLMGFADPGGFHVLTNLDRQVETPDDMWGMKLRAIPGFAPLNAMIEAVKARPVDVSSRDVLAMLSTGALDGQFSPPSVIMASGFDNVQKNATVLNVLYSPYIWVFNSASLNALSPEDRALVHRAAQRALDAGRQMAERLDGSEQGLLGLTKRMRVITLNASARRAFRDVMQPPVQDAIIDALGDDRPWMDRFLSSLPH